MLGWIVGGGTVLLLGLAGGGKRSKVSDRESEELAEVAVQQGATVVSEPPDDDDDDGVEVDEETGVVQVVDVPQPDAPLTPPLAPPAPPAPLAPPAPPIVVSPEVYETVMPVEEASPLSELDDSAADEGGELEDPPPEDDEEHPPVIERPVPKPALPPETVPDDTAALVRGLLDEESRPGWKRQSEALAVWQGARNLKPDGRLGPATALRMAQEISTLPIVRYWPKGSYREGPELARYRSALADMAMLAEGGRRTALIASSMREQGQGFGQPKGPIANLVQI